MIHWELYKKLRFDHSTKWYKQKHESLLEIETHKIPWDFELQTNHLISARIPDLVLIIKKKNSSHSEFCHPSGPQNENKRMQKDGQILWSCQRTKKAVEHEGDGDIKCK